MSSIIEPFTRQYETTAVFQTPLGPVHIRDSRDPLEDRRPTWVDAEFAEAKFNFDPEDKSTNRRYNGSFTINRREYQERVDIKRSRNGGIYISAGGYGNPLTDSARKKLTEILAPLVEPLKPRLPEEDYWEKVEALVRGEVRGHFKDVPDKAEKKLRELYLTYYKLRESNGANTEDDAQKAHDMAVRVINEEITNIAGCVLRTLSAGFKEFGY